MNITRQAVAKWEKGVSIPRPDMMLMLAKYFDVSVDYLLGRENTGYIENGIYAYCDVEKLLKRQMCDMYGDTDDILQNYLSIKTMLPKSNYWKKIEKDDEEYTDEKNLLISDIKKLNIEGMPEKYNFSLVRGMYLTGRIDDLNNHTILMQDDDAVYFGTEYKSGLKNDEYFGILANEIFLIVVKYGILDKKPVLMAFVERKNNYVIKRK